MGKEDFDQELSAYLSDRKKRKIDVMGVIKGFMPKPTPPAVELPPEIQPYGIEEETKNPEPEPKEEIIAESLEEEVTGKKKSVWHAILGKLKFKPHKKELEQKDKMIEEEEEGRIKEMVAKELMLKDLRDISKIALDRKSVV